MQRRKSIKRASMLLKRVSGIFKNRKNSFFKNNKVCVEEHIPPTSFSEIHFPISQYMMYLQELTIRKTNNTITDLQREWLHELRYLHGVNSMSCSMSF